MTKLSDDYRIQVPKRICEALNWKPGDEIDVRFFSIGLVAELGNGSLNLDSKKLPIILFNREVVKNGKVSHNSIFD